MKRLLIGGSPCTYWSIAQKNNRETEPSGLGWELFKNYLIAKEKFKPDWFLYENNKSAAESIKSQIRKELQVWDGTFLMEDTGARYIEINSALVSAQNRQRFYVHNCGDVAQPEDREITLKDVLESGLNLDCDIKSYALTATYGGAIPQNTLEKCQRSMVAESSRIPSYGNDKKSRPILASYKEKGTGDYCLVDKCFTSNATKQKADYIAISLRIGDIGNTSQGNRVYSYKGKSVALQANGGGVGAKTGLYLIPIDSSSKTKPIKIYEIKDGWIEIKGKRFSVNLADGYYVIRKLSVKECCRLQTLPDDYCRAVSDNQAYKGLGNGWTAEVIIHILNSALQDVPKDEPIEVLSIYDGIGTGRYCLDKMGFRNIRYYAYEIDKYAMKVAQSNYPDIIECGDAFEVRKEDWRIEK